MAEPDGNGAHTGISYQRDSAPNRPPVALGCGLMLGLFVLLGFGAACAIVFFESGADSGEIVLQDVDAYAPGSAEFVGEHNFFVVRTQEGQFEVLDDLDAANRANQARRCRVQIVRPADPEYANIRERYQGRFSAAGARLSVVFREGCNGAIYDGIGVRLDAIGERNLDRFGLGLANGDRLEVRTGERICTVRREEELFARVEC